MEAEETSRRVAIQHRIGHLADDWIRSVDPCLMASTDSERLAALRDGIYALEQDVRAGVDPGESVLAVAAEAQLWLEAVEREQAR